MIRGSQDRSVAAYHGKTRGLGAVVKQHPHRIQPAASMRIVMDEASQSEAPRAGARAWRGEHLVAADTGAVIAVSEQYDRRDLDHRSRAPQVHPVYVDDVGAPLLEGGKRLARAQF